ncbi:MAG: NADP-dependent malic enzyme [Legionellaceae bacterium]
MSKYLEKAALEYHAYPNPGKISIHVTKPVETAWDLALAYSPGVAAPVIEIGNNPNAVYQYTAKANLVGVISNGTAILGLGNLGPLASKPVMEGKGVLFKRFAGIDVFDIEIATQNPDEFIQTVKNIAPTFGGINLEDIKAPECFEIEKKLIELCDIPVFHDDQHGTAIVITAGLLNALELQNKTLSTVRIVCLGAGAAAFATMQLLLKMGANRENIYLVDRQGVIHDERQDLNQYKAEFAIKTNKRSLEDAMHDADVFIGLSGPNLLSPSLLLSMAPKPIIFACSNPDPEINFELAHATRDDLIFATGRSDYPNQINNVLAFPYIFRGALDVRARIINDEMKIAAVDAIRTLTKEPIPHEVLVAYQEAGIKKLEYGADYIIPKPMDPRLLTYVSAAVAKAAIDTKVALNPYPKHYPL